VTATAEQYATAAELLRRLASQPDRLVANGDGDLAELTQALEVEAQACEEVDEADRARGDAELECEEAALGAAHLWSLVERAAEVIDASIAEGDGSDWETLTLAFELRQAVEAEPDELGARLLGELLMQAMRLARRVSRPKTTPAGMNHEVVGTPAGRCNKSGRRPPRPPAPRPRRNWTSRWPMRSACDLGRGRALLTLSLLGCALGVYYASELRVLMAWLRQPDPRCPPVQPAWHVLACAAGFALLALGAAWTWGTGVLPLFGNPDDALA
jgi:hypothetical protein